MRKGLPAALALAFGLLFPTAPGSAQLSEVADFGSNPGELRMWLYLPTELSPSSPLVVALHGCGQSASVYGNATGWIRYADLFGFALLLPEQRRGWLFGNNPLGCFNWFYRDDQTRDQGEALSIKQMVDYAVARHSLDPDRVFISGLSAGGAMTAVMLAVYPETFAGGAVIAGIPYACSSVPGYVPLWSIPVLGFLLSYTNPFRCLEPGTDLSPAEWGARVRAAAPPRSTGWPRVSVWHGTDDDAVMPVNAMELMEQWTEVHGADQNPDAASIADSHEHRVYRNDTGDTVVELYLVKGIGHGIPVHPPAGGPGATAVDRCGMVTDYVLAAGICANFHIARFWGLAPAR